MVKTTYASIAATEEVDTGLARSKQLVHNHYSHRMSNMNKLLHNVKIGKNNRLQRKKKTKSLSSIESARRPVSVHHARSGQSRMPRVIGGTPVKGGGRGRFVVKRTPIKSTGVVEETPMKGIAAAAVVVTETPMKGNDLENDDRANGLRIRRRTITETPDPKRRRR